MIQGKQGTQAKGRCSTSNMVYCVNSGLSVVKNGSAWGEKWSGIPKYWFIPK